MKRRHMFKILSAWLASATVPLSAAAAAFPRALGTFTDYKLIYPRTETTVRAVGGTTAMCSMMGPDPWASAFATTVWPWRL